jgi:hypothetical protein
VDRTKLTAAVLLAACGVATGQTLSLQTDWGTGGSYLDGANAGTLFDVTANATGGIRIQGLAVRSYGTPGTPFTAEVYYREGSHVGFEQNAAAWTLLGTVPAVSTGRDTPTPLAIGGLAIPEGMTYGIYINHVSGGTWFKPISNPPFFSNSDVRLDMGAAQMALFGGQLFTPRTASVTVHYTLGMGVLEGACCLPSGGCEDLSEHFCALAGGVYEGNGTSCAGTTCPSGACCLPNGSCVIAALSGCNALGGIYQGNATECASVPCPQPGACCLPTGCVVVAEARCAELSGSYSGHGVACSAANCPPAQVNFIALPGARTTLAGDGGGNLLVQTSWPATIQMVIAASEFDRIPPGSQLIGIAWRQRAGNASAWPTADNHFTQFDIELATSLNPPGTLNTTFAANVGPNATLVRQGPLTFPASSFPGGATAPNASGWGPTVHFTTPFVYEGGPLLITVRRSIASVQWAMLDIISSGPVGTTMGYGTLVQTVQNTVSSTAPTGSAGSYFIAKVTFVPPQPPVCYANCDGSTTPPILNVEDFTCFINEFAQASTLPPQQQVAHYANCDESTTPPVLNVEDFSCFINAFAAGCP